ncbi:MAG TPA: restriction endonuclease subunit S [Nitrosomonas nitrosa]|nr:restriction endonuclease subunit S [Nitrosomonas nitrosa]
MNKLSIENFSINKSNWSKVKFGDVVFEPKESVKYPVAEGIEHVVGLEHIDSEDIHLRSSASIDKSTTFTKKFAKGDVLFGRRRAYLKKSAQATFGGICSGDITVMRVKANLLPELLPFIVNNEKFFDYAVTHSAGGLSPRVKFKDLAKYEFLLPTKEQQAELSKLLWAMESTIESQKSLLASLKNYFLSEIERSVPNRFDNVWVMADVITTRKGVTYKSSDYSNLENGVPLLSLKSIERGGGFNTDGIKYYLGECKKTHFVKDDDLIVACTDITRDGNVVGYPLDPSVYQGKKMIFTMDLIAIEVADDSLLRDYLYYVLKARWVHWFLFAHSPGTTVLHLDISGLKKLKIPKRSLREQEQIVTRLRGIESSILSCKKSIESNHVLQKTIINQVF